MFLAPLNYDRFFKKVFSNLFIAQRFLEDFLGVTIESIEFLERKHKVTDGSAAVEFDFRCKIDGQFVIIDMQQWYKADVVKRFYVYHAVNSALQLETLPKREYPKVAGKEFDAKIYSYLLPTITLIWMADDNLGFKEDYVAFALCPEQVVDFLKNDDLWASNDVKKIGIERQKVLTLLRNDAKSLDFLSKNRMIYAFQKNIVHNKKYKKYFRWFEFAEKTRNKDNIEEDFDAYKDDKIFMEVMERLQTNKFEYEELSALDALERELALSAIWKMGVKDELREEVLKEVREEVLKEVREEVSKEVREEVSKEVREEISKEMKRDFTQELTPKITQELTPKIAEELNRNTIISAYQQGLNAELIANITHQTIEKVLSIIEEYKANKDDK